MLLHCWFCYLGSCGQDGWKFNQFNPSNLLPVLFFLWLHGSETSTRHRAWYRKCFYLEVAQKPVPLTACRRTYTSTLPIVSALGHELCLWYLCEVSASSLSHRSYSPTYSSVFSKCSVSPACEVTEAHSESTYSLGGSWGPKDQGWWQWDWIHIYLRSAMNRNEFISKCLWVMKNKMVCSIPDCILFRGLEDVFLTCVSDEEKWIVLLICIWLETCYIRSSQNRSCTEQVPLSRTSSDPYQDSLLGGQPESLMQSWLSDLLPAVIKQTYGSFWLRYVFHKIHVYLDNSHIVFGR